MSAEDTTSERVRFDDNVSFIDENLSEVVSVPLSADQQQIPSRLLKVSLFAMLKFYCLSGECYVVSCLDSYILEL